MALKLLIVHLELWSRLHPKWKVIVESKRITEKMEKALNDQMTR